MIKIFSINLKYLIEQQTRGTVYIEHLPENDSIKITIHSQLKPFVFTENIIHHKIRKGLSSQGLANHVLLIYRKYVLNAFFC